jgi:hypothetical protein
MPHPAHRTPHIYKINFIYEKKNQNDKLMGKVAKKWHIIPNQYFFPDKSIRQEVAQPIGAAAKFFLILSSLLLEIFHLLGVF